MKWLSPLLRIDQRIARPEHADLAYVLRLVVDAYGYGTVAFDLDLLVVLGKLDRLAIAGLHRIAIGIEQRAIGAGVHSAIASIQCALRRGDREERIALNGNVERIAGRLDGTIGVVDVGGAVLHKGDAVVAAGSRLI